MIRLILLALVAFLLPAFLWVVISRARRRPAAADAPDTPIVPWDRLVLGGAALALAVVLVFLLFDFDTHADCNWIPSRVVDGQLQPAHCK